MSFDYSQDMTWTCWDSDPGPPPCKGGALPAELQAQGFNKPAFGVNLLTNLVNKSLQVLVYFSAILRNQIAAPIKRWADRYLGAHQFWCVEL
jgi:hypothetical protein